MPRPGDKRKSWEARTGGTGRWTQKRLSVYRRAWTKIMGLNISLYMRPNDPEDEETDEFESGTTVTLYIARGASTMRLPLSQMTLHELNATKEIFDLAFANARPTVLLRDRLAQEAFQDGDDSFNRIYREVPRVFVREGTELDDSQELLRGHDWVPAVGKYEATPGQIAGIAGGLVPQRNAGDRSTEDDTAPVDLDEGIRPLDG